MSNVHQFPKALPRLHCSKCGVGVDAACDCGAAYVSAGKAAQAAVKANPQMSNRAIAEKIGVHHDTVAEARKAVGGNPPTESRTGKDGKKYPGAKPLKTIKNKAKVDTIEVNDFIRELAEFTADYSNRIRAWNQRNPNLDREDKKALMRTIHQCADAVLGLAQAIDGR